MVLAPSVRPQRVLSPMASQNHPADVHPRHGGHQGMLPPTHSHSAQSESCCRTRLPWQLKCCSTATSPLLDARCGHGWLQWPTSSIGGCRRRRRSCTTAPVSHTGPCSAGVLGSATGNSSELQPSSGPDGRCARASTSGCVMRESGISKQIVPKWCVGVHV